MAQNTLEQIFAQVRGILSDTQISGGEVFTDTYLPPHFAEPYRSMFARLTGGSKRIQRVVGIVLPAMTSVAIPSTYNIFDLSEPEMVEERPAPTPIAITATTATTPIRVTATAHGLSSNTEGFLSGIAETTAPWGNWFITVIDANTFSLNGSASDGIVGTTGNFYPENNQQFVEVQPSDLQAGGLDGQPQSTLGVYIWRNEMFNFRGAVNPIQLRITYYASGTPPTNVNYVIPIDNAIDFLATATAANAALSKGWLSMYERFFNRAYGDPAHPTEDSLLDLFYNAQVLASQRGPQRRQMPFRDHRYKFGSFVIG